MLPGSTSSLLGGLASSFTCPPLLIEMKWRYDAMKRSAVRHGRPPTALAACRVARRCACVRRRDRLGLAARAAAEGGYGVVITGASKGVGLALAAEHLRSGDRVAICARGEEDLEAARQRLSSEYGEGRVFALACDVSDPDQVRNLAEESKAVSGSPPSQRAVRGPPFDGRSSGTMVLRRPFRSLR